MFQRFSFVLLTIGASSLPAYAQEAGSNPPDSILRTAQAMFLFLGMMLAAYRAYGAFDTPPVPLGDGPTPPRYMTQPGQFRLATITYVAICLTIYGLIVYFYKDLLPLVDFVAPPELRKLIEDSVRNGSLSFPLVVIFSGVILVILLNSENNWNPLFMLRRLIWGWVSIPQLANAIMIMARDELVVPTAARTSVASDSETPDVDIGDFEKGRHTLDRRWAELCYIRLWLARNRAQGTHFTFFNEPSFFWENLDADYDRARENIASVKRSLGQPNADNPNLFASIAGQIDKLRRQYCRLAACFIVYKNETKKNALRDCLQFGVTLKPDVQRGNPLRYIVIFLVSIIISVYIGVWLSAMFWDLLHGNLDFALRQDPDLVTRWTFYALANYGMPILAVLLWRYLDWTIDSEQPTSYLISYATIFLIALGVSVVSLVTAIKLAGTSAAASKPFLDLVFAEFKWSVSPALVSVYVAYHLDRQIDPCLPDIGSLGLYWRTPQRILSCVCFGLLVVGFSLLPSLSLSTVPNSAWSADKLRMVVIGTTFIVGLLMALAGEFCLIKPATECELKPTDSASI